MNVAIFKQPVWWGMYFTCLESSGFCRKSQSSVSRMLKSCPDHQLYPCGFHDHRCEGTRPDGRFLVGKFSQDAREGIQHTQPVPGVWGTRGVAQADADDLLGTVDAF